MIKKCRIRSFSGPYFPACKLNMAIYRINLRIQSENGKIRNRETLHMDTFYASDIAIMQKLI